MSDVNVCGVQLRKHTTNSTAIKCSYTFLLKIW